MARCRPVMLAITTPRALALAVFRLPRSVSCISAFAESPIEVSQPLLLMERGAAPLLRAPLFLLAVLLRVPLFLVAFIVVGVASLQFAPRLLAPFGMAALIGFGMAPLWGLGIAPLP